MKVPLGLYDIKKEDDLEEEKKKAETERQKGSSGNAITDKIE